ncbi:hypothetical protein LguiB_001430 [Lonicera macranthoides]
MRGHYPHSAYTTNSSLCSCSSFFLINNNNCSSSGGSRRRILSSIHGGFEFNSKRKEFRVGFNRKRFAVEERDSEFEVDPDKAREALRKLDQQLQSLSEKPVKPPKIRVVASEVKRTRDLMTEEQHEEFTGTSLPYIAFFLLIFTLFYNVLFATVIKPSIDGPEPELSPPSVTMSLREDASSPPEKIPPLLEYLHRFE